MIGMLLVTICSNMNWEWGRFCGCAQVNLAEIHLLYIAYSGWIYTGRSARLTTLLEHLSNTNLLDITCDNFFACFSDLAGVSISWPSLTGWDWSSATARTRESFCLRAFLSPGRLHRADRYQKGQPSRTPLPDRQPSLWQSISFPAMSALRQSALS